MPPAARPAAAASPATAGESPARLRAQALRLRLRVQAVPAQRPDPGAPRKGRLPASPQHALATKITLFQGTRQLQDWLSVERLGRLPCLA